MLRVLDIGSGPGGSGLAAGIPDAEITLLDVPGTEGVDIEVDLESPEFQELEGEWDAILLVHVLEHLHIRHVGPVLRKAHDLLKPWDAEEAPHAGIVHVIVPSLEWVGDQLYWERNSPVLMFHLYGNQQGEYQDHHSGYTMPYLRQRLMQAGFRISEAHRVEYHIQLEIGGEKALFPSEQNYVVGVKDKVHESTAEPNDTGVGSEDHGPDSSIRE